MLIAATTPASLAENIAARKAAAEIVELCGEQPEKFWRMLAELAREKLPPEPAREVPGAMDYSEAVKFEREPMPFGKYANTPIGDVPEDYLLYVTENDFASRLKRYLQSRRFQDRQG